MDGVLPDLWPVAVEAGWSGLLVSEDNGGAGLAPFDAMLVAQECGRVLAGVALLGHVPASYLLDRGGYSRIGEVADGSLRAAYCPARPPGDVVTEWTVEPRRGLARGAAPVVSGGEHHGRRPVGARRAGRRCLRRDRRRERRTGRARRRRRLGRGRVAL